MVAPPAILATMPWPQLPLGILFQRALFFEADWEVRQGAVELLLDQLLVAGATEFCTSFFRCFNLYDLLWQVAATESARPCQEVLASKLLALVAAGSSHTPDTDAEFSRFIGQVAALPLLLMAQQATPHARYGSELDVDWQTLSHPPPPPGSRYHLDADCF
jgi:hypothetical protein